MKIYSDKELKNEIGTQFDFGVLPAGTSKIYEYWIKNDKSSVLKQLTFSLAHEELKIVEAPTEIIAFDVKHLAIQWDAAISREEGLKVDLRVLGIELFG